ncbi:hypothetical protein [Marinobacter sp. SS5-14b]|uniref:hypothetical protein n=1 Tax=Marinobacter sp. SS5-14b TaxID=3050456 RepID=UPI0026DF5142|nr:hypothetical protein [Marinobacter sp. SS5-14b]
MFKKNTLLRALIAAGLTTGLAACGGGSSGGDGEQTTPNTEPPTTNSEIKGQFVDSPVQGLTYFTPSGSGVTNANGEFNYIDGDEVFFLIGNTLIGQSVAAPILTPVDLSDDSSNADKTTNILRFLQSLDENNNPSDGIVIPENVLTLAETQTVQINFDQSADLFETDATVMSLLSEAGQATLVSPEEANAHFNQTLSNLPGEIDIRGTWIATTIYQQDGQERCRATATWTFSSDSISISGEELSPEGSGSGIDCGTESFNYTTSYNDLELESDPGWGCSAGLCSFSDLNRQVDDWDESTSSWQHDTYGTINERDYSVVKLSHRTGSDAMTRVKRDFGESTPASAPEEQNTSEFGVFKTTFIRKEAIDYRKDMRGTWNVTSKRASCPETIATHTITYSDTGISVVGEELNRQDGVCVIENMNETLAYDSPELPAEFCGPTCTWEELNGVYSDEGDAIKLSHKRGTNTINRTKGFDSREVWVKQ